MFKKKHSFYEVSWINNPWYKNSTWNLNRIYSLTCNRKIENKKNPNQDSKKNENVLKMRQLLVNKWENNKKRESRKIVK